MQRLDKTYAEILQEVRVAQTGVQGMLAFSLTLAFAPRFGTLTAAERQLYVITLMLVAVSASLLMAPAALNRLLFNQPHRRRLVQAANRFALFGLAFLLASFGTAIMLILRVIGGSSWWSAGATSLVVSWFAFMWFAIPAWWRYRHRECGPQAHVPAAEPAQPQSQPAPSPQRKVNQAGAAASPFPSGPATASTFPASPDPHVPEMLASRMRLRRQHPALGVVAACASDGSATPEQAPAAPRAAESSPAQAVPAPHADGQSESRSAAKSQAA